MAIGKVQLVETTCSRRRARCWCQPGGRAKRPNLQLPVDNCQYRSAILLDAVDLVPDEPLGDVQNAGTNLIGQPSEDALGDLLDHPIVGCHICPQRRRRRGDRGPLFRREQRRKGVDERQRRQRWCSCRCWRRRGSRWRLHGSRRRLRRSGRPGCHCRGGLRHHRGPRGIPAQLRVPCSIDRRSPAVLALTVWGSAPRRPILPESSGSQLASSSAAVDDVPFESGIASRFGAGRGATDDLSTWDPELRGEFPSRPAVVPKSGPAVASRPAAAPQTPPASVQTPPLAAPRPAAAGAPALTSLSARGGRRALQWRNSGRLHRPVGGACSNVAADDGVMREVAQRVLARLSNQVGARHSGRRRAAPVRTRSTASSRIADRSVAIVDEVIGKFGAFWRAPARLARAPHPPAYASSQPIAPSQSEFLNVRSREAGARRPRSQVDGAVGGDGVYRFDRIARPFRRLLPSTRRRRP